MKKKPLFLILALFLGLTFVLIGRSHAAPIAQSDNLLKNPGFDPPAVEGAAQSWGRWHRNTPRSGEECMVAYHYQPKWSVETNPAFVHSGSGSQAVGNAWDTWSGGVYQTIPATPGTVYRFSAFGRGRASNKQVPDPSDTSVQMNMRVGIDPNGSGLWNDADVVWGAAGSPHDTWQQFVVEVTATGNQITVFTSADWGVTGVNQCRAHLDTWFDTGELVALTSPTATPAPLPTQAPIPATQPPAPPTEGVPTEPAAATVVATMTQAAATDTPTPIDTASICVNAFLDANANGLHDPDEGYVAGVTFTVAQGTTIVGQAVSTGSGEPICFNNLPAGVYEVGQTPSPSLEMTTQANATITVGQGQTVGLEFGSRLRLTPTAGAVDDPTGTAVAEALTVTAPATGSTPSGGSGTPGWLVGLGIAAIGIGVLLLGTLLFMMLRR